LGGDQIINTLVLRPDDRIVVGGSQTFQGTTSSLLAFYLPNGAPDNSPVDGSNFIFQYGSGGSIIKSIAFSDQTSVYNTTTQLETPAVYFGGQQFPGVSDFFIGYYWTGVGGNPAATRISLGGRDIVSKLIWLPNRSLAAVGSCIDSATTYYVFCATRTSTYGTPDEEFGTGGTVLLKAFGSTIPNAYYARSALAQPDGKLVLAGECKGSGPSKFCIARLNQDGSLDKTFGENGTGYTVNTLGDGDSGRKVMMQANGKLVVSGTCTDGTRKSFCLVGYSNFSLPGRHCSLDLDGDGSVQATTDLLIASRIAAGMTGPSVIGGMVLTGKPRSTWKDIREYLIGQCGMSIAR
jgi:uncharacterized delta-60 repeat protein